MSETARIEEAMKDYWGERCSESDTECDCCAAWNELDELTALRAEVERLRVDAERWRVVRRSVWRNDRMQGLWGPVISFDLRLSADSVDDSGSVQATLDAAIDAALAEKPNTGGGE